MDLTVGTSSRFTVTANFNDGSSQDVTASSTWTSGSSAVATVGDSGLAKGRVIGGSANTTDILISAVYGGLPAITAPVKVTQRTLQSLAIFGSPTVASGNKAIFATTANFSDGTSVSVTDDTTWTIDNPFVAVLADSTNQPGQVVGVDRGTATLTANFGGSGGKTATATITVQ
jgi:hypothetical protein